MATLQPLPLSQEESENFSIDQFLKCEVGHDRSNGERSLKPFHNLA
jgi:hypothetical protein